jgi:hypothetical protein
MQEITIRLWRNRAGDWSLEINGQRYEHVPLRGVACQYFGQATAVAIRAFDMAAAASFCEALQ